MTKAEAAAERARRSHLWSPGLNSVALDLARRSLFGQSSAATPLLKRAVAFKGFLLPGWDHADHAVWNRACRALEAAVVARGFGRRRCTVATILKDAESYRAFLGGQE